MRRGNYVYLPGKAALFRRHKEALAEAEVSRGRVFVRSSSTPRASAAGAIEDEALQDETNRVRGVRVSTSPGGTERIVEDVIGDSRKRARMESKEELLKDQTGEDHEEGQDHEEDVKSRRGEVRGSEKLQLVIRACGPTSLNALQTSARGAAMAENLAGTERIKGVDFSTILKFLHEWVRPAMDARRLQLWLCREAPCFESSAFASPPDLRREFKLDSGSTRKYKSPLARRESRFARLAHNAVYAAAHALGASDEELKEALTEAQRQQ